MEGDLGNSKERKPKPSISTFADSPSPTKPQSPEATFPDSPSKTTHQREFIPLAGCFLRFRQGSCIFLPLSVWLHALGLLINWTTGHCLC